ncbi:MAG: DNA polymerase III subunit delta [Chloroflexi bacterium]|nr:DNA polymerase III subunit delta [Chloroflexota bacterium]
MAVHILYGPDSFSLKERLAEIRNGLGARDLLDLSFQQLDGSTLTPDQFANVCQAMPFMVSHRLVVVDGLLSRFEPRSSAQGEGQSREVVGAEAPESRKDWTHFARIIKSIPQTTVLVLVDGEIREKSPFLADVSGHARVEHFKLMKADDLFLWIRERAVKRGVDLPPQVANYLIELLGNNLWLIDSELQKLALFCAEKTVSMSDVQEAVSYAREASVFQFVDVILQRRLQKALEFLRLLRNSGAGAPYLLAMLTRETRRLLLAGLISAGKVVPQELARESRLLDERDLRIILAKAKKYSLPVLEDLYQRILQTDIAIKTGKSDPDMAIEMLIGNICNLAAPTAPRS